MALNIPHSLMATGMGMSALDLLAIEADAFLDGYESEQADFYAYWLDRLERLTKEQRELQVERAKAGKRFR